MLPGDDTTDPRTPRADLTPTAAAFAAVHVRRRASAIADRAADRAKDATDPRVAAEWREIGTCAKSLYAVANLASTLPRLSWWKRVLWALLVG